MGLFGCAGDVNRGGKLILLSIMAGAFWTCFFTGGLASLLGG